MGRVRLFAVLAVLGQLVMVLAGTIESWRGPDASSHIETRGTQLHHAHDEASCPACVVQLLHARPERPSTPPLSRRPIVPPPATSTWSVGTGASATYASRAPPI
ncbi:MAG TPA: hypothetical protein VFA43_13415 [Gemmatimonadaceae bacterium]|nr:hypothetical protein [Gemmatimonadaceae bacterium]